MNQWPVAYLELTDASQQTLVSAPAAGQAIQVHGMYGSNSGASLSRVHFKESTTKKFGWSMAANGGGFAVNLGRAWTLPEATALTCQQSAAVTSDISCSYSLIRV